MKTCGITKIAISSADFVYGQRPMFLRPRGWFAFPNTEASHPCIHDLNSRKVAVSLDPGFAAEGLTCTWHSTESVDVRRTGDLSAELKGDFPPNTTTPVTYTLSHPDYLFGATTYTQNARFCPQIDEGDLPDWDDHGGSDDEDDHDEYWCCFWGICCSSDGTCSCGCEGSCGYCGSTSDEGVTDDMDEVCPVHQMPYELCASLHDTDYAAARRLDENVGVLRLHDPLEYDRVELLCPHGAPNCCGCPEHQTNYVAVARRSYRLKVADDRGADFSIAHEHCFVNIAGTRPSTAIGDAVISFVTNGAVSAEYAYTVLGMEIAKTSGPSLDTYNSLSSTLGFPMTVNTNLNHAAQLTLKTNVRLPGGTAYGGWRFHEWESGLNPDNYEMTNAHYSVSQASAMVADGSITNNPVFNRGFTPMFDHDMSQDDQWLALAKYVPAVSHPVGGMKLWSTPGKDIDMNSANPDIGVPRPNGWGRKAEKDGSQPWKHSDMKDIAYFYVYKLYEQLITKGNLK